jgi:hypothetical protein
MTIAGRWAIPPRKARRAINRIPASKNEAVKVADIDSAEEREPATPEDEAEGSSDVDWEENEPSPHQGEQGQENEL